MNKLTMMCMTAVLAGCSAAPIVAVGTGTWVIAAVIPKYLSQRLVSLFAKMFCDEAVIGN